VCHDTDARHEYANEVHVINKDYLTVLQQEWRDSNQQSSIIAIRRALLQKSTMQENKATHT